MMARHAKDWTADEIPVDEDTPIDPADTPPDEPDPDLLAFLDAPVKPIT